MTSHSDRQSNVQARLLAALLAVVLGAAGCIVVVLLTRDVLG
jgi:hypothetical protein